MMYEFHGWIRLAESPSDIDEGGLDAKLALLQSGVAGLDWSNGRAEIMIANGLLRYWSTPCRTVVAAKPQNWRHSLLW